MEAWHFLQKDRRLRYGSGELVEVGKTIEIQGAPIMCERGLHASLRAIDALSYAPGPIVSRVVLGGHIIEGNDKVVATQRTVIWMADATELLFGFSCWVAEEVLKARQAEGYKFEQASFDVIQARRDFQAGKITQDELDRFASAAWSAALSAAWSAARSAARLAALLAAESAAWLAAESAAESAARLATWSAARSAAGSAAGSVAGSAARSAQNEELERRLYLLREE